MRRQDARTHGRTVDSPRLPGFLRPAALLCVLASVRPGVSAAQRAPVLRQIAVPHNYYYREMYLPQVTSGPSSVAWSPDGTELVYSMQGSLWRQRLGSTEASQLTDGPGYDYQPDWSPDGRYIVYTSYWNDALELWLLDTRDGSTRALVANGAVNLDPRWSPDGTRIAYASTAFQGRWHVYLLPLQPDSVRPSAGTPVRLTSDTSTSSERYYYGAYDQYLSPTWSPDGTELILVSNRDRVYGSGGLWRMEARPGAPMHGIRDEETNWKARPDWSRDGRRVVYSSYLGGQRNHLWLTPAAGGDPFELTYCECDHTGPRWSPEGRRVAFISNREGTTSLPCSLACWVFALVANISKISSLRSITLTLTISSITRICPGDRSLSNIITSALNRLTRSASSVTLPLPI